MSDPPPVSPENPPPSPGTDNAAARNKSISQAVVSSLASKVGTVILQFVSLPIAFKVLGEDYGLYATIAIALGPLMLFQIGIGPALTHGLSRAREKNDSVLEKRYFSTSWFLLLGLTALAGLLAAIVLKNVPLTYIFGGKYAGLEERMLPGLWLALGIILLEFILSHTERAREGFLQVHINNLFGAAGNVVGAVSIVAGIYFFPTIEFLILAVFGSRALARVANCAYLFFQRPDLLPSLQLFDIPLAKELLTDGVAFTVSQSLTSAIEYTGCGLIVAHIGGPMMTGFFQILMGIATTMMGLIVMVTTPTWPAVVDAFTRRDFAWVRVAVRRLWLLVGAYGLAALVALPLLGPLLLPLLYGDKLQIGWLALLAFGFYFALSAWGHTNNALLIGIGLVRRAALFSAGETFLVLLLAFFGMKIGGLAGLLFGMGSAMLLVTAWYFPLLMRSRLRSNTSAPTLEKVVHSTP